MAKTTATKTATKKTAPEAPTRDLSNVVGITLETDWVVDLDELDFDVLRECQAVTGRTEILIISDVQNQPGRVAFANFVWLASRSAGWPLTYEEAAAKATNAALMKALEAGPLSGIKLQAALEAQEAARPQP
jgi:hypothetical protein